jgi:hypothetical protein
MLSAKFARIITLLMIADDAISRCDEIRHVKVLETIPLAGGLEINVKLVRKDFSFVKLAEDRRAVSPKSKSRVEMRIAIMLSRVKEYPELK